MVKSYIEVLPHQVCALENPRILTWQRFQAEDNRCMKINSIINQYLVNIIVEFQIPEARSVKVMT